MKETAGLTCGIRGGGRQRVLARRSNDVVARVVVSEYRWLPLRSPRMLKRRERKAFMVSGGARVCREGSNQAEKAVHDAIYTK